MSKKRKEGGRPAARPSRATVPATAPVRRRDVRPFLYAGFDLVFGCIYIYLLVKVSPNRHGWAQAMMLCLPVCAMVMGLGTLIGSVARGPKWGRLGWIASVAAGATMLVLTVIVLALLLASAAFLSGVYGAFGKAAASGVLAGAALTVELVGLLPAFQLKYLLTRAGRRAFGLAPLWDPPVVAAERA